MIDYVEAIRRESARFLELVSAAPPDSPVPSCPGWTVADLTWHLAEVQHTWASVVADLLLDGSDVPDLDRPADEALADLMSRESAALVDAVSSRNPGDECWSWSPDGRNVGWVRRRQAHEALVHRVDAELAGGTSRIDIDEALAADGVDEILTLFMDASDIPDWSSFAPAGSVVEIGIDGLDSSWCAELGRFQGTSPASGNTYDEEAVRLIEPRPADATIRGSAGALDRWLWGRGTLESVSVRGDAAAAAWIRSAASHATQ